MQEQLNIISTTRTIRTYKRIRMIHQASAVNWTIVAYDEKNKEEILSLSKEFWIDNIKVVILDRKNNWINPSLIIIDDQWT